MKRKITAFIFFCLTAFIVFISYSRTRKFVWIYYYKIFSCKQASYVANDTLKNKKWVFCGDSFSSDAGKPTISFYELSNYYLKEGSYAGFPCTYPYIIGNKNKMIIKSLAMGGRTLAEPEDASFQNSFSKSYYKEIDKDADIITLYFGINDSHHSPIRYERYTEDGEDKKGAIYLGDVNDTTKRTFCGAYNFVIKYIKEYHSKAKLGIIVSNGCDTDEYRIKTIEIAKKWNVPYIDLNGDENTPPMLRTTNPIYESKRDSLKREFAIDYKNGNSHPSYKAHLYQSKYIESFLINLFKE